MLTALAVAAIPAVPSTAAAVGTAGAEKLPIVRVPKGIADDCSRDVTAELNEWIGSVGDGSKLQFGRRRCYRIESSVSISGRSRLVIDGRGSTFKAETKGTSSNRRHFHLVNSREIVLRNVTVRGANPKAGASGDAYVPQYEQQHAFELRGSEGVTLDRVRAFDVHGDFVYVGGAENGPGRDIRVRRSVFERGGRQGISIVHGEDIVIEGNTIGEVPQAIFDLEPNLETGSARDVRIVRNKTGDGEFFFSSEGRGVNINDIVISDNEMKVPTRQLLRVLGPGGGYRGPVTITGNDFKIDPELANLGVIAAFTFARTRDVTIRDNVAQFPNGTNMPVVREDDAPGLVLRDNSFPGASRLVVSV